MPVNLFCFGLLLFCFSEGELLGALFSYIIQGEGGFPYLIRVLFYPPVHKFVVSAAVFVTELAGVLCVVLVSLTYLQELAGVLCVVPYCLCCLEHARVPCVVQVCLFVASNSPGYLV